MHTDYYLLKGSHLQLGVPSQPLKHDLHMIISRCFNHTKISMELHLPQPLAMGVYGLAITSVEVSYFTVFPEVARVLSGMITPRKEQLHIGFKP